MKVFIVTLSLISCSILWAKSSVDIHVSLTPAGSFTGVSDKIKGKISKTENGFTSKRIELNIRSIKTGIDLRDEHLWEHLNYKTHSKATLTELKASDGTGTAFLEVNGVKIPVNVTYKDNNGNVDASFKVKASSFNLPPKSYLGVGVSDEVLVNVKMDYK